MARTDDACLAFSPASRRHKSQHAELKSKTFFGGTDLPMHPKRHVRATNTRVQANGRCVLSTCFAGKGQNSDDVQISDDASIILTQKFIDSIRQSLVADIIPEVLKGTAEFNDPTIDFPLLILLAVSGGSDSIALFHAMEQLTNTGVDTTTNTRTIRTADLPKQGIGIPCEIHVVHFDHQQRGKESDADKIFVENLASKVGFEFHSFCWGEDCDDDIDKKSSFSQDAARNWRQVNLIQLAKSLTSKKRCSSSVILTAHHRDDFNETVLLKLLRGAHISNLSGMDSVKRIDQAGSGAVFAKPMLELSKTEIEDFLTAQGLAWRKDSSNESNKYLRNRVRKELMPLLTDLVGEKDILHVSCCLASTPREIHHLSHFCDGVLFYVSNPPFFANPSARQKRIESLVEQSRKVKADLLPRAAQYLTDCMECELGQGVFPIPTDGSFTIVHEQALHTWAESQSGGNLVLSYDQVKRVTEQVSLYPQRKKWTLHVGKNWNVRRNGDILLMEANDVESTSASAGDGAGTAKTSWKLFQDDKDIREANVLEECTVQILVPPATPINDLELKCVDGNQSNKFVPPWRKGRSPIKIKDFLRAKKVPLCKREGTPILCLRDVVVGVYIEEGNVRGGKWIIHADHDSAERDGAVEIDIGSSILLEVRLVKLGNN